MCVYKTFRKHSVRKGFEIRLGSDEIQHSSRIVLFDKNVRATKVDGGFRRKSR